MKAQAVGERLEKLGLLAAFGEGKHFGGVTGTRETDGEMDQQSKRISANFGVGEKGFEFLQVMGVIGAVHGNGKAVN